MGKKVYYEMYGIGKSKYVVNYHNGKSKHNDGSDFFDTAIFKNKKKKEEFIKTLRKKGYIERRW